MVFKVDMASCTGFTSSSFDVLLTTKSFDGILITYFTIDHKPLFQHEKLDFQVHDLVNPKSPLLSSNLTLGLLNASKYLVGGQTTGFSSIAAHNEIMNEEVVENTSIEKPKTIVMEVFKIAIPTVL